MESFRVSTCARGTASLAQHGPTDVRRRGFGFVDAAGVFVSAGEGAVYAFIKSSGFVATFGNYIVEQIQES